MAQAAAATGISKASLKRAKEKGCPAFKGSRVDGTALREWLKENESSLHESGEVILKDQKLAEEVRKLRIRNDKDEEKTIPKGKLAADLHALAADQLQLLRQRLENELPATVAGLDPSSARIIFKRVVDEIAGKMQQLVTRWTE